MSGSEILQGAEPNRYPRSAHATIRGYLYQTCLGVLRWLDLKPNEILLCEGDEDLDRFLLDGGSVSEQVKAYSGKLGLSDQAVLDTLRSFLRSYVTLGGQGKDRRFVFTTTAQPSQQRGTGLDFDLLEQWRSGNRAPKVLKAVRALLISKKDRKDGKDNRDDKDKKAKIKEAVAWLDEADGWKGFLDAVEWTFEAPDLDAIRQKIRNRLAAREDARLLSAEILLERLIVRVLDASIEKDPRDRTLSGEDLSGLLDAARTDLGTWAASSSADRIRTVFNEAGQIHRLMVDGTSSLPEKPAPGKLLTAAYEVIPFDEAGRREELELLASWCDGEPKRSVLLLTGEGGSGKTRLMIEWCRRLRHQGWHAGFLRRDRDEKDLDPLLEGAAPRLVVVDYAETRLGVVEPLVLKAALASQGEGPKLRLVLLARRQADWWNNLFRQDHEVGDLLGNSPSPRGITTLIPKDEEERRHAFRVAVEGFAWQLRQSVPTGLKEPNLSGRDFSRVLYLHMAALAALQGKRIETAEDALKETLYHERRFWNRQVEDEVADRSLVRVLQEATAASVTVLTLTQGAADQQQAKVLLDRVLTPFPLQPHHPVTLLRLLRGLYGADGQGGRYLEPLQPDLLGEQLVAETLAQDSDLLRRILDGGSDADASSTLTILTRLAQRQPELKGWLRAAFQGRLEQLAELALDVAVGTGDPIGQLLAEECKESGAVEVMARIRLCCDDEIYLFSVPLREVALAATETAYRLLRERRDDLNESQQAEYAKLAGSLGFRLKLLGRREDALRATQEAVEIRRQLAQLRPDAFLSDLARSLNNLGTMLSELGHRKNALRITQEAVEIYRQLAQTRPDASLPELARSLDNLGNGLSELGRREDALRATREAVEIRRQLAQTRPDSFLPDFATSLNNLGTRLSELGRREDALCAAQEAVEIYRQLAQTRPDVFFPDLAMSLDNLGNMLSKLGHREDALRATQEAVEIRRELAQTRPDAFNPDLALSLNNLGTMLSDLGRTVEAFLAAEEAVRTLSPFFLRLPAAFAAWMDTMTQNYLERAEAAGKEPDEALLAPIVEVLQSLSASQDAGD